MPWCSECNVMWFGTDEHRHLPEWEVKFDPEYPDGAIRAPDDEPWYRGRARDAEQAATRFGETYDSEREQYLTLNPDSDIRVLVRAVGSAEVSAFRVCGEPVTVYHAKLER
jgi:hypothetical protein